jgi:hypothetical protein
LQYYIDKQYEFGGELKKECSAENDNWDEWESVEEIVLEE